MKCLMLSHTLQKQTVVAQDAPVETQKTTPASAKAYLRKMGVPDAEVKVATF